MSLIVKYLLIVNLLEGGKTWVENNTQFFHVVKEQEYDVASILKDVYEALTEKGYNPVNQIVGYIMSGDPTYITSHKNARSLIMKVERDEILEVLFENYIDTQLK